MVPSMNIKPMAGIEFNSLEYVRTVGDQRYDSSTFKVRIPKIMPYITQTTSIRENYNRNIFINSEPCRVATELTITTQNYITVRKSDSCDLSSIAVDGYVPDDTLLLCACMNNDINDIIIIDSKTSSTTPSATEVNQIELGTDMDDILTPGIYTVTNERILASLINAPFSVPFTLIVSQCHNYIMQDAVNYVDTATECPIRKIRNIYNLDTIPLACDWQSFFEPVLKFNGTVLELADKNGNVYSSVDLSTLVVTGGLTFNLS